MRLTDKLRFRWTMLTKGMRHGEDFMDHLYKIYLNHDKIIHWRGGLPVFSGSSPPPYSKPAAYMLAKRMMAVFQNRTIPNLMSFAINDICNAGCDHCSFFEGHHQSGKHVLSFEEAKDLIRQAQDLGVSIINFVGGEPLMRKDICEIIASVDKDRSVTSMFTNGWYLPENVQKLKASGLDTINVSLDSADPAEHDKKRKVKGLFERGVEGLRLAKKAGMTTAISCCVFENDIDNGNFEAIVEMGKKIGVHEIIVFDAIPAGRMKNRKDLMGRPDIAQRLIDKAQHYNTRDDYPGILVYSYVTSWKSTGCCGGISYFYVTPYGDICCCDFNPHGMGNVLEDPLQTIWDRFGKDPEFLSASWNGCKTKDPDYRERRVKEITSLPIGASTCGGGCTDCNCGSVNPSPTTLTSIDLPLRV